MRLPPAFLTACLILLTFIAACDRKTENAAPAAPQITEVDPAPVSDELPGLPAAATGIAFWRHPTLSFNSTMIVVSFPLKVRPCDKVITRYFGEWIDGPETVFRRRCIESSTAD